MEALLACTRPLPTAFVINLDRDTVRLTHMEAECARVGIPMQRWPAMLGAALPPALASSFAIRASGSAWSLSSGEIGCYASHVTIWQALVDGALGDKVFGDVALVMEDDLRLEDDFVPAIQKTLAVAPSGWDLIRLSNAPRRAFVSVAEISPRYRLVHYTRVPCSCGAYLISRSGAKKLLACVRECFPSMKIAGGGGASALRRSACCRCWRHQAYLNPPSRNSADENAGRAAGTMWCPPSPIASARCVPIGRP